MVFLEFDKSWIGPILKLSVFAQVESDHPQSDSGTSTIKVDFPTEIMNFSGAL